MLRSFLFLKLLDLVFVTEKYTFFINNVLSSIVFHIEQEKIKLYNELHHNLSIVQTNKSHILSKS